MNQFQFDAPAELFVGSSRGHSRRAMQYRRFDTGAEAIRYAVENLPPELLARSRPLRISLALEDVDAAQLKSLLGSALLRSRSGQRAS